MADKGLVIIASFLGGKAGRGPVPFFTVRSADTVSNGFIKTGEDIYYGFVHCCNARNGKRPGDYPYRIGAVPAIFSLPQLVAPPPAQKVPVDHRDERQRFRIFLGQLREPCGICGSHMGGTGLWVFPEQYFQGLLRVFHSLRIRKY